MSDFLATLAARSLGMVPTIRPRLASFYEPPPHAVALPPEPDATPVTERAQRDETPTEGRRVVEVQASSVPETTRATTIERVETPQPAIPRAGTRRTSDAPVARSEPVPHPLPPTPPPLEPPTRRSEEMVSSIVSPIVRAELVDALPALPRERTVARREMPSRVVEIVVTDDREAPAPHVSPRVEPDPPALFAPPSEPRLSAAAPTHARGETTASPEPPAVVVRPMTAIETVREARPGPWRRIVADRVAVAPLVEKRIETAASVRPRTPPDIPSSAASPIRVVVEPRLAPPDLQRFPQPIRAPRDVEPAPDIHVTIGRVEVRAVTSPTTAPRARTSAASGLMTLDDYLRRRGEKAER
jgi:hypothetical protein